MKRLSRSLIALAAIALCASCGSNNAATDTSGDQDASAPVQQVQNEGINNTDPRVAYTQIVADLIDKNYDEVGKVMLSENPPLHMPDDYKLTKCESGCSEIAEKVLDFHRDECLNDKYIDPNTVDVQRFTDNDEVHEDPNGRVALVGQNPCKLKMVQEDGRWYVQRP
ncbi:hypothetical protein [Actinomyces vulturis]|uniref:hypothetical protein n=1 Tax=Actinomyces vulturis TaxID=1857645 RepID=UPI000829C8E1|nr:hypothetical protein [Actinomyces vulturis]